MRFTGEKLLAIPCKCEECGAITLWGFKEILSRNKDQSVVHCARCGSGEEYSKKKMIKTFIREDMKVRLGL